MRRIHLPLLLLIPAIGGCAAPGEFEVATAPTRTAPRPAYISHVVLVELHDPEDSAAFISDCDRLLGSMRILSGYACGPHYESGRETVLADYDVGLYVGFDSREAYETYVTHPDHVELVESWRDRIRRMRVYDIADATP